MNVCCAIAYKCNHEIICFLAVQVHWHVGATFALLFFLSLIFIKISSESGGTWMSHFTWRLSHLSAGVFERLEMIASSMGLNHVSMDEEESLKRSWTLFFIRETVDDVELVADGGTVWLSSSVEAFSSFIISKTVDDVELVVDGGDANGSPFIWRSEIWDGRWCQWIIQNTWFTIFCFL